MKITRLLASVLIPVLLVSCSIGRKLTPQSDIAAYEIGEKTSDARILVASRDSDFKIEVARNIGEELGERPVYVKFIGVDQLDGEDASAYTAVIVMTTCIAWGMDSTTESFLRDKGDLSNVVVLVTSGAGDWAPDPNDWDLDAVTSASVMENAGDVAREILDRLYAVLESEA
jgi:hypothetical protein